MGDICSMDSSESNEAACCFGFSAPFVRKEGDPLLVERAGPTATASTAMLKREPIRSGWPWMKNAKVVLASSSPVGDDHGDDVDDDDSEFVDAIEDEPTTTEPVNSNNSTDRQDNRLLVKDLLREYYDLIVIVQQQLALQEPDLYDPSKHDDLWILRFLLSHKKSTDKALAAAKTTLHFRHKHLLDHHDLRAFPPQTHHDNTKSGFAPGLARFWAAGVGDDAINVIVPNVTTGGVIAYLRVASLDTHGLGAIDQEDWLAGLGYVNEWSFQWLDYITRTTGRLTKAIRAVDVEGIHWGMQNNETQYKYTAATREMQDVYPQAVQMIFVCRAPQWIQWPWWILKPLMPTRVVEKIDFINPQLSEEDLKLVLKYVPEEVLPERFGGKLTLWPPNIPPPPAL